MYIKQRQPFKHVEAKITDVRNVVELHQGALEFLKEAIEIKDVKPTQEPDLRKQSLMQKLKIWKLRGGGK